MYLIDTIMLAIGNHFSRDIYSRITQVQGILWSVANTAIVYYFLKISDWIRIRSQQKPARLRYLFLLITVILSVFLLTTKKGGVFFALEAAIYGIQYLILLYTLVLDRSRLMDYFKRMASGNPPE